MKGSLAAFKSNKDKTQNSARSLLNHRSNNLSCHTPPHENRATTYKVCLDMSVHNARSVSKQAMSSKHTTKQQSIQLKALLIASRIN